MLKRIWRRLSGTLPQRSEQQEGSNLASPRVGRIDSAVGRSLGGSTARNLSEAEYEPLFMQLLDGVSQGWSRGKVQGFLIAKNLNQADLVAWLQRFGEKLRESSQSNQELVRRMVLLSQVGCGELSEVAGEISRDLLSKSAGTVPTNSLDDADIDRAEAWLNQGNQQAMAGDLLGAVASYSKALEVRPDYYDAWVLRGAALADLGELEQAIASYEKALAIHPDLYFVWHNRGIVLGDLKNFEQAITSFDKALAIQPNFYESWIYRSVALCELKRFEQAIASFDKALEIHPYAHEAWYNQGKALSKLGRIEDAIIKYDKASEINSNDDNVWFDRGILLRKLGRKEEALASYDKAIEIRSDCHEAFYNRGLVLCELGQWEQAITSFDNALISKSDEEAFWNDRGLALLNLGNFEEAIASCDKALEIQPNFHLAWYNRGGALASLGEFKEAIASCDKALAIQPNFHPAWMTRGVGLYKLNHFEEAIASFDKALAIQPDFHPAWINRGNVAAFSVSCQTSVALSLPPAMQNLELDKRGYEGRMASFKEGLKHCPQDTHPEGWGMLHQAIGKAHYSQGRGDSNYRYFWRKAVDEYRQALITLTKEAFPEQHLEVVQELIRVLLGLGKNTEAKQWRLHGLEVFEDLLNSKKSSFQKRQLEIKFSGFSQMRVDVLIEDGELVPALRAAERNKNLCLTWILDAQKEHILSPSYQQIQQLVNPTSAIIYWHLSPHALTTFIIKHNTEEPIVLSFPPFLRGVRGDLQHHDKPNEGLNRLHNFENWVNDWNKQYQDYRNGKEKIDPPQPPLKRGEKELVPSWRDNLPNLLKQLSEILNIPAILSKLLNIKQLILIPHRDLHRFPLHALFPDTFTITYLPSAQIGLTSSSPPLTRGGWGGNLLSIEHPNSENFDQLPHAEIESAAITQLFNNPQRLAGKDATKTAVETALRNEYNIFYFTGHGTYDFNRPNQSSLTLSGTDKLTLEEICKIPLSSYQLVSLSACETALTGNQTIETEYVGLVSAFVYHRVSHVISTLWTVESAASALFMIKCYRLLKKGVPETVALRKTQQWLRQLAAKKLARLYRKAITQLPADEHNIRPFLKTELKKINRMEPTCKPYEHPYHWAAFTLTGLCEPDAKNNPRIHSAKVKTPDL